MQGTGHLDWDQRAVGGLRRSQQGLWHEKGPQTLAKAQPWKGPLE